MMKLCARRLGEEPMMARTMALLFFATLLSSASWAQDLLACVDPDIRQTLLSQGLDGDRVVSRSVPEALSDIPTPEGFEFVGSSVSKLQTSVAYKTNLATDTAVGIVAEALETAGWSSVTGPGMLSGGFVNNAQLLFSMLCREDEIIGVAARQLDDSTFVKVTISNLGTLSCGDLYPRANATRTLGVAQYLPRLSLLEDAGFAANGALGVSGSSGGNRTASTIMSVVTQLAAQDLIGHFGRQLEEQGWTYDSGWSGGLSAGTTWSARPNDDAHLIGVLEIVSLEDSRCQASFRATLIN